MEWSDKYKKSINCNNPKGFSQKAHCAGKKKRNKNEMKLSEFKEAITKVLRERSINAISKLQQKNIEDVQRTLDLYKKVKSKGDAKQIKKYIDVLKKLGKEKQKLAKELDDKVSGMYKDAEYKGESVNEILVIVDKFDKRKQDYDKVYYQDGGKRPGDGDINKAKKEFAKLSKKHKGLTLISVDRNSKMYDVMDESVNEAKYKVGDTITVIRKDGMKYKGKVEKLNPLKLRTDSTSTVVLPNPTIKKVVKESINEGPSREEFRIAAMAIKKQAKFRNVSPEQAIQDQLNALKLLQRYIKKGDVKKYTGMNLSEAEAKTLNEVNTNFFYLNRNYDKVLDEISHDLYYEIDRIIGDDVYEKVSKKFQDEFNELSFYHPRHDKWHPKDKAKIVEKELDKMVSTINKEMSKKTKKLLDELKKSALSIKKHIKISLQNK